MLRHYREEMYDESRANRVEVRHVWNSPPFKARSLFELQATETGRNKKWIWQSSNSLLATIDADHLVMLFHVVMWAQLFDTTVCAVSLLWVPNEAFFVANQWSLPFRRE